MNNIFSLENYRLADAGCSLRRIWDLPLKERVKIALVALENCEKHLTVKTPEPDSLLALNHEGAFIAEFDDLHPIFERLYLELILLVKLYGGTEEDMLDKLVKENYPDFFISDIESAFYYERDLDCDQMKNTLERLLLLEFQKED